MATRYDGPPTASSGGSPESCWPSWSSAFRPATSAGLLSYRAQLHNAQIQSSARHQVTAHLTGDAVDGSRPDTTKVAATAAWITADGSTRTATVTVWPGERAGTAVALWLDSHDTVVSLPVTATQAAATGWTTAAMTAGSGAVLCLALWKGSILLLNRARYALWDAEWTQVEPRWSKRLPN